MSQARAHNNGLVNFLGRASGAGKRRRCSTPVAWNAAAMTSTRTWRWTTSAMRGQSVFEKYATSREAA